MRLKRRTFLTGGAALMLGLGACRNENSVSENRTSNPPNGIPTDTPIETPIETPIDVPGRFPNVVFIAIDDLNDWVGFLGGHRQVITPNMDKLAKQSVVFERAYCNAPLCGPSRASALSGMYPYATGVFDHSNPRIPEHLETLPDCFTRHGYRTKLIGKVYHHFSNVPPGQLPDVPLPNKYPATNLWCSGYPSMRPEGLFDWAPLDLKDDEMTDGQFTSEAIDFLSKGGDEPFFLGVGYIRTHVPWYVPKEYYDLYPTEDEQLIVPEPPLDEWDDLPEIAKELAYFNGNHACITGRELWASAVRGYLASISFVDAQVGRLLDFLDNKTPYRENTIVVLWSDNGFHLGEKFHWHKMALWKESVRVPFLMRMPGGLVKPTKVHAPVSLIDIYPTLVELCGLETQQDLQGNSLVPLLGNPAMNWNKPVLTTYLRNHHAIRTDEWCYIRYEDGAEELYDIKNDPNEYKNLARYRVFNVKETLGSHMPEPILG